MALTPKCFEAIFHTSSFHHQIFKHSVTIALTLGVLASETGAVFGTQ